MASMTMAPLKGNFFLKTGKERKRKARADIKNQGWGYRWKEKRKGVRQNDVPQS